jgi:hypothetical protein
VVPPGHHQAVAGNEVVVQAGQGLRLVVEGADVQGLHAAPLGERGQAHVGQPLRGALGRDLLDGFGEHRFVDPLRRHDQQRPVPSRLVARRREGVHVVGPPQALERHDDVVALQLLLAGELQLVGQRIERLGRPGEVPAGVGVAVPVDHQVLHLRHVNDLEPPLGCAVAVELLLEVRLEHGHLRASQPSGSAACKSMT